MGARIWAKRSRAHRVILVALGLAALILSLGLALVVGLGVRAPLDQVRAAVTGNADAAVTLSAPTDSNAKAQDAGVRREIARVYSGAHVVVTRSVTGPANDSTSHWLIAPDPMRVTPPDLAVIARADGRIDDDVTNSSAARSPGIRLSGHGRATVAALASAVAAVGAVLPIPITVLVVSSLVAVVLLRRLLGEARANETRLLRARGGDIVTLVRVDTVESVVLAVVGSVLGAATGQALLAAIVGVPTGVLEVAIPLAVALLLSVGSSVILSQAAARSASGMPESSPGRARAATSWSLVGLVLAVAAIALWRFLQFGAPAAGTPEDPGAVVAPASILVALALLALILMGALLRIAERAVTGRPGIQRLLPIRLTTRYLGLIAGPVALLVLAVGTTGFTAAYSETWATFLRDSNQLVSGGDLTATFGGAPVVDGTGQLIDVQKYGRSRGVSAAAPVIRETDQVGDESITVLGVDSSALPALLPATSTVADSASIVSALGAQRVTGIALPRGSRVALGFTAKGDLAGGTVAPVAWIEDPVGDLAFLPLDTVAVTSAGTSRTDAAALPAGGPWTIVALDATITAPNSLVGFSFALRSIAVDAHPVTLPTTQKWRSQDTVFDGQPTTPAPGTGIGFSRALVAKTDVGASSVRIMPAGAAPVPVVVSRLLATANHLRIGSSFEVDGQTASFEAKVAGIVPLVPGTSYGGSLLADLRGLDSGWLRGSQQVPSLRELWMSSADPSASAAALRPELPPGARVLTAQRGSVPTLVGNALSGLWIGSVGSAAFFLIALIASLAATVRRRRDEPRALRALGVGARAQVALRRTELVLTLGYAAIVGLATGLVLTLLAVTTLARASAPAAPGILGVAIRVGWTPFGLIALALVVGVVAVSDWYLATVRRTAETSR